MIPGVLRTRAGRTSGCLDRMKTDELLQRGQIFEVVSAAGCGLVINMLVV